MPYIEGVNYHSVTRVMGRRLSPPEGDVDPLPQGYLTNARSKNQSGCLPVNSLHPNLVEITFSWNCQVFV